MKAINESGRKKWLCPSFGILERRNNEKYIFEIKEKIEEARKNIARRGFFKPEGK